jgi:two-component system phosphate regulon response regulator OmpR
MNKILLVEDSIDAYQLVDRALGSSYELHWAQNLQDAFQAVKNHTFDLILLDVMLPDGDGFKLCSVLQTDESHAQTPVIFLTAKNSVSDKVLGFSVGADDYIPKPFDPIELKARVESKLRKKQRDAVQADIIKVGEIEINKSTQSIRIKGQPESERVELTPIEFKILLLFAKAPGKVFSRDEILNQVWGESIHVYTRSVDTHVSKLRKKITPYSNYIQSVHGSGYRFYVEKNDPLINTDMGLASNLY